MDPKGHIVLAKYPGEWEAMPSYIESPRRRLQWVSIREQNREKHDLPTVFSILIYTHPETGFPLAICDGSHHTVMRTGSAAAVSAKWLARKDSKVLAIVGAGHMAAGVLATCNEVFRWQEVRVWSRSQKTLDHFTSEQQPKYTGFKLAPSTNLEQVVRGADVVVTVTPARGPIVKNEWIGAGTHIAALGADKSATRNWKPRSCSARGSSSTTSGSAERRRDQRALSQGLLKEADSAGEIGEVVTGKKKGRTSDREITLFDSTGIALQDSATIPLEYERALAAGVGIEKKMIST
jgi:alanine dehydrogenase